MTVGDQTGQQMRQEVVRAAMAGMLDLTHILELIVDALDDGPLAEQQFVGEREQAPTHVLADFGDELDAVLDKQGFSQRFGDVAPVAKELAEEPPDEARNGLTVIDMTLAHSWLDTGAQ